LTLIDFALVLSSFYNLFTQQSCHLAAAVFSLTKPVTSILVSLLGAVCKTPLTGDKL